MSRLAVSDLAKRYKAREVVRQVSLHVDSGDVVGLLGPNGAGKTTCFYLLVGLVACDRGRILLDDLDITAQPLHARALAMAPRFILLDEPFAGVDPIAVLDIHRIITQLTARGIGVLITDHNVRETLGICQRAYIMSAGDVIAQGDAATILANQQVKEVYLGEGFRF
jgi:ABC-type lipopolysaccharide export system ATPase subunit